MGCGASSISKQEEIEKKKSDLNVQEFDENHGNVKDEKPKTSSNSRKCSSN